VVENLNVKGLVRNHKLAKAISDCGWGVFINFLSYKLEREDKKLVEIDRFFPSSHICPDCLRMQPKMDLSVREWTCINSACNARHDRDEAASRNIRAEGIRMLQVSHCGLGRGVQALGETPSVSPSGFRRGASGEPVRADGAAVSASEGSVRQDRGRKTKVMQHPAKLETPSSYEVG